MVAHAPLDTITTLQKGAHEPHTGMCMMEAVAHVAGEPWSDAPECVSPVIVRFCLAWNDGLPDDPTRTRLLAPLIPVVIGTRTTTADEQVRSWMALEWLVRIYTTAWLDLTPSLAAHAAALRALPPLLSDEGVETCRPVIHAARAAVWGASRATAGPTEWAVEWAAARSAAGAAAGDAAWAAAVDATCDVAWDVAEDAAGAAEWTAARAASWAALAPTIEHLQVSAVALVRAMCAVGRRDA